jgi:hypothetical protein
LKRKRMRQSIRRTLFLTSVFGVVAASALDPGPSRAADLNLTYVSALAALDEFLEAWRTRNATAGLARVSSAEQKRLGVSGIRGWLIGVSSPNNAAFEVSGGRTLSSARYRFTVKFYYSLTGGGVVQPPPQAIDLTLQSNGSWLVDAVALTGPDVK